MTAADGGALRITVRGRVQGVSYRAFAQAEARRLGLDGWARNRADGSVEAVAAGADAAMAAFLDALRRGPPAAVVTAVKTEPTAERPPAGFEIRT